MQTPPDPADEQFLTAAQVRERYGSVSHMWLVRRLEDSDFPRPVHMGKLRFFKLSELLRWEATQLAAPPPPSKWGRNAPPKSKPKTKRRAA